MFYKVEWKENGTENYQCIYKVKDFETMWKVFTYMNCERAAAKRPAMRQMIITAQDKCDGEFFEITGDLDVDLTRDAERYGQR